MLKLCQRWRRGRDTYRPAGEPIDVARFGVDVVPEREARPFVKREHYSGSYPAARLAVGLFRARRWVVPELVGVAVFSTSMQPASIPAWTGQPAGAGVELGRFVLLDEIPANGETWMLSRAFRCLAEEIPEVRAVLSYADPHRLVTPGGVVTPGHIGIIYQAHNGRHVGRSKPRWRWVGPDGKVISERALSKLRNDERGAAYAYRRLCALGAPARRLGEDGGSYVARALQEGPFLRDRHPGCLAYVWPVGGRQRETARGFPQALPYPKEEARTERVIDQGGAWEGGRSSPDLRSAQDLRKKAREILKDSRGLLNYSGGVDGARTRDLRRDRPAL